MKKKIIIIVGGIFWPLGIYLTNQPHEYIRYILPTILITSSLWLYNKKAKVYIYPLLLIPIVNVKLTFLPFFILIGLFLTKPKLSLHSKLFFLFSVIILITFYGKSFSQQSIFKLEYEKKQEILREINLYPNPFMARIFQNKARIVTDKFSNNLLALIDPGNYFFSFHPREGIFNNQNLVKYPFLAIIPILIGMLEFKKIKHYKFTITILTASIFSLSVVEIFDRSDFILWLPITLIFIHGVNIIYKSRIKFWQDIFSILFIINCLIEFVRIIYIY